MLAALLLLLAPPICQAEAAPRAVTEDPSRDLVVDLVVPTSMPS